MKTNLELQRDVQNAIRWEPLLHEAPIGVTAKDGVVSLSGVVDSYVKKMEAENAAKGVLGVKAVVEHIEVVFPNSWSTTDSAIALTVIRALENNYAFPEDKVRVTVEDGWVTLEGQLPWQYQKEQAKNCITYLRGIKGVLNKIVIRSETQDTIEEKAIRAALHRNLALNDNDIRVVVLRNKVILSGVVGSMYQKEEAARIAWKTPGIWNVANHLAVDYSYELIG